jgi:uncharacterized protein with NAD-binding domain and iron-sulfur cluster
MDGTVHIVGAGLAGLSAAVELCGAGRRVVIHESGPFAGGRCRSYYDSVIDLTIDNGNHLLLSGNASALDFLSRIGTRDRLQGATEAAFPLPTSPPASAGPCAPMPAPALVDFRRRTPGARQPRAGLFRPGRHPARQGRRPGRRRHDLRRPALGPPLAAGAAGRPQHRAL